MTAQVTPAEVGGRILHALGDGAPRTGEEHLLTGLATLLTGRYCAAAPLLRQAIGALAAEPGPSERVPVWLLAITFAADAIWEDRFALAWVARCEDLARRTGAMRPLTLCLIGASITNGSRGQLVLAEQQFAEALPAIVEAGLRSGHPTEAAIALADLERCATASGTGWALGLLARSKALMAPPDQAGQLYQESIDILGRTTATADLARAHLLLGEWLRRNQRPADARGHLSSLPAVRKKQLRETRSHTGSTGPIGLRHRYCPLGLRFRAVILMCWPASIARPSKVRAA
jgi:hypothetical protein